VRSHNKVRLIVRIFRRKWSAFCMCGTTMTYAMKHHYITLRLLLFFFAKWGRKWNKDDRKCKSTTLQ